MTEGPARRVADELGRRGLAVPARLVADAHRPLAPLIADIGAAVGPLVEAAFGRRSADLRALADDPHGIDRLIAELDSGATRESRAEPR